MSKHSKGPWTLRGGYVLRIWSDNPKDMIATVHQESSKNGEVNGLAPTDETALANAALIAQAPTMLKGLKAAVAEFERISYQKKCDPELLEMLKLCIAKAEGKDHE